jgi:hypothetical protein
MYSKLVFLKRRIISGKQYQAGDAYPSDVPLAPHLINQLIDMRVLTTVEDFKRLTSKVTINKAPEAPTPYSPEDVVIAVDEVTEVVKFTEEDLAELKIADLRAIGNEFEVKDNNKSELINKILAAQG